jgi:hypothetical protein
MENISQKTELNSSLLKHREFLFTGREHSAHVMKMNQETGVMEGVKKRKNPQLLTQLRARKLSYGSTSFANYC